MSDLAAARPSRVPEPCLAIRPAGHSRALEDECGDYLQPGSVDALQGAYIERYGLRLVDQPGETLFEEPASETVHSAARAMCSKQVPCRALEVVARVRRDLGAI